MILKKKICLLGSFAVGKTSLVERFVYNRFDESYLTTIGARISQKVLEPIQDPKTGQIIQYNFLIWDIAKIDKFDFMVMNYYRGAAGALIVADLTRPETIANLDEIHDKFVSVSPTAHLLLLGNKVDIFQKYDKTITLLKKTASRYSIPYLLTSAKTGTQVEKAFHMLAQRIGRFNE